MSSYIAQSIISTIITLKDFRPSTDTLAVERVLPIGNKPGASTPSSMAGTVGVAWAS